MHNCFNLLSIHKMFHGEVSLIPSPSAVPAFFLCWKYEKYTHIELPTFSIKSNPSSVHKVPRSNIQTLHKYLIWNHHSVSQSSAIKIQNWHVHNKEPAALWALGPVIVLPVSSPQPYPFTARLPFGSLICFFQASSLVFICIVSELFASVLFLSGTICLLFKWGMPWASLNTRVGLLNSSPIPIIFRYFEAM